MALADGEGNRPIPRSKERRYSTSTAVLTINVSGRASTRAKEMIAGSFVMAWRSGCAQLDAPTRARWEPAAGEGSSSVELQVSFQR